VRRPRPVALIGLALAAVGVAGCFDTKAPTHLTRQQVIDQLLLTTDDKGRTYVDDFDCVIVAILPNRAAVTAGLRAHQQVVTNKGGTIGFRAAKPRGTSCWGHLRDDLNALSPAS
jgi:hypothetical protein